MRRQARLGPGVVGVYKRQRLADKVELPHVCRLLAVVADVEAVRKPLQSEFLT